MTTATAETPMATTIQDLLRDISGLSGDGIQKLAEHAKWLLEEQEIAALKAKYGTTPNAETIAAMEAAEAGIGELVTLEQIQAECDALR